MERNINRGTGVPPVITAGTAVPRKGVTARHAIRESNDAAFNYRSPRRPLALPW